MADLEPGPAQLRDHLAHAGEGAFQRGQIGQLAADVHGEATHLQPRQRRQPGIDRRRLIDRHAELVVALAGGDLLVCARVDIGVDAQGTGRGAALRGGKGGQFHPFFFALDIELADVRGQRVAHLAPGLADAGEHDIRRRHPGQQRPAHFPAGDDIRAIAFALHHLEHGKVGIGLHRKGDVHPFQAAQRRLEHLRMALQRGARIDIDRRADLIRDPFKRHIFGVERAVAKLEMVHELLFWREIEGIVRAGFGFAAQFHAAFGRGLRFERQQRIGIGPLGRAIGGGRQRLAFGRGQRGARAAARQQRRRHAKGDQRPHRSSPSARRASATRART